MSVNELNRDTEFFLDIDLARRAAIRAGIDPNNPWLTLTHCSVDEVGVSFSNGATVKWNDLGLGELIRIDLLFTEYVNRLPGFLKERVKIELPFRYSPGEARWFFKKEVSERLFLEWANQLAVGANSFVL